MGGVAWQWQLARWQRVVRLESEPGRVMPIWASSAWICWCRRARSSMVTGFLIRRAGDPGHLPVSAVPARRGGARAAGAAADAVRGRESAAAVLAGRAGGAGRGRGRAARPGETLLRASRDRVRDRRRAAARWAGDPARW